MFKKLIEKLYLKQPNNLVYFDQLCRCFNRNYYEMQLKKLFQYETPYVTVLDINGFKECNDRKGHAFGDAILSIIVDKCEEICGSVKHSIVRYGGDEFVVTHAKLIDFGLMNSSLCSQYGISVSYGTTLKSVYESLPSAVDRADKMMYKMKQEYYKIEKENIDESRRNTFEV